MSWGIAETASEIEKIKSESADYLNGLNSCGVIDWNTYNYAFDFYEDLLKKAYEQGRKDAQLEPCQDAVSRQDAINALDDEITITGKSNAYVVKDYVQRVKRKLENLPPVTPKRKKGQWKKIGHWGRCYSCDQCGNILDFNGVNAGRGDANFCPNCDADMRQREENK